MADSSSSSSSMLDDFDTLFTSSNNNNPQTTSSGNDDDDNNFLFSEWQQVVLGYAGVVAGFCSLVGSLSILHSILCPQNRHRKLKLVYQRLMLGLSTLDCLSSFSFVVFGPWSMPQDVPYFYHAKGNWATCEAGAFLVNFSQGSCFYSAYLSIFFVLLVRFQTREEIIAKRIEPWMHFTAVVLPLVTGAIALSNKYFNPIQTAPGLCWLDDYPSNCNELPDTPCIRGTGFRTFATFAGTIVIGSSLLTVIVCMVLLVLKVRETELKMQRYSTTTTSTTSTSDDYRTSHTNTRRTRPIVTASNATNPTTASSTAHPTHQPHHSLNASTTSYNLDQSVTEHSSPPPNNNNTNTNNNPNARLTITTPNSVQQLTLTKRTAVQALLYITAFLLTYLPVVAMQAIGKEETAANRTFFFPFSLFLRIGLPSQGWFNAFIYRYRSAGANSNRQRSASSSTNNNSNSVVRNNRHSSTTSQWSNWLFRKSNTNSLTTDNSRPHHHHHDLHLHPETQHHDYSKNIVMGNKGDDFNKSCTTSTSRTSVTSTSQTSTSNNGLSTTNNDSTNHTSLVVEDAVMQDEEDEDEDYQDETK